MMQVVLSREGGEPVGCMWEGLFFFFECLTPKMKPSALLKMGIMIPETC